MFWLIFFAFITKAYADSELEQALRERRQAAQEAFHAMVQLPANVTRAEREAAGKRTLAPAEKRLGEVIQKSLETRVQAEGVVIEPDSETELADDAEAKDEAPSIQVVEAVSDAEAGGSAPEQRRPASSGPALDGTEQQDVRVLEFPGAPKAR